MTTFNIEDYKPPTHKINYLKNEVFAKSDTIILYLIISYLIFGFILALLRGDFGGEIFLGVVTSLAYWFTRQLLRSKPNLAYAATLVLFTFCLQFLIQTKGALYVRFIFVLTMTALIMYQNWRVLLLFFLLSFSVDVIELILVKRTGIFSIYSIKEYYDISSKIIDLLNSLEVDEILISLFVSITQFSFAVFITKYLKQQSDENMVKDVYLKDQLNIEANTRLARQIAEGQLSEDYTLKSNDQMGKALLEMRDNLKLIRENDKKLKWVNIGITSVSELLLSTNDINRLSNKILRELVKYLNSFMGGLFILNENSETTLELQAFYAYNKRQKEKTKVELGEGLVGEAALKKKTIFVEKLSTEYETIASGLGEAKPESILIVPLKVKEELLGVIELASFKKFQDHEIQFVEKISENIAITLLSVRASTKTKHLLEEAQIYNVQMTTQEEEMRQSMEELQSTQEEIYRTQKELQQYKINFDGFINSTDDSVVAFDMDYNIIIANDAFKNSLALDNINFNLGDNIFSMLPKESHDFWKEKYAPSFRGKTTTFSQQTKGRRKRFIDYQINPIKDPTGTIVGVSVTSRDITDRKKEENKISNSLQKETVKVKELEDNKNLLENEILGLNHQAEFYDTILSFVNGAFYKSVYDKFWFIDFISKGITELTSFKREDFLDVSKTKFSNIMHPEDVDPVEEAIGKADENYNIQYRIITKDKKIKWVTERGKKLMDKLTGQKIAFGFINDITDFIEKEQQIVKTQEKLQQFKMKLDSIINNAPDSVFAADKDYNVIVANKAMVEYNKNLGIEINIGDNMLELLSAKNRKSWKEKFDKALKGESYFYTDEIKLKDKDKFIKVYLNPITGENNDIAGASIITRDITKETELEKKLVELINKIK